eukprot:SAG22_NODE_6079_length_903_cov_1.172886_1_plen_144_part_01
MSPGAEILVDGDGPAKVVSKTGERIRVEFPDGRKVWRQVSQVQGPDGTPAVAAAAAPAPAPSPKKAPAVPGGKKKAGGGGGGGGGGNDPFQTAVKALKTAATKDAAYKKMKEEAKPEDLVAVAVLYTAAMQKLDSAITSDAVNG